MSIYQSDGKLTVHVDCNPIENGTGLIHESDVQEFLLDIKIRCLYLGVFNVSEPGTVPSNEVIKNHILALRHLHFVG